VWTLEVTTAANVVGSAELFIAGAKQTTNSVVGSKATFTVTNAPSENIKGAYMFWDIGLGDGNDKVGAAVAMTAKFVSVSPNVGSQAGQLLTVNVQGVGRQTTGLDILDSAGNSICASMTIEKYGEVLCRTKSVAHNGQLSVSHAGATVACTNTDTSKCAYATNTDHTIVSANLMQDKIVFQGSNLQAASSDNVNVHFAGVNASSVVVDTQGSTITANFPYGVPFANGVAPEISFNRTNAKTVMWPIHTVTLTQAKTVGSGQNSQCSFAGGCEISIQTAGISSKMNSQAKNNNIKVCGEPCMFSENSSPGMTTCRVPAIGTTYSNREYGIEVEDEDMKTGNYFGSNADYMKAFDDELGVGSGDNSANCEIGMEFNQGFVGLLGQVKFFLNNVDLAKFDGQLVFQGDNGQGWKDLFTTDGNVHEGWNYKMFEESVRPAYRRYRFFGKAAGSCDIKEIKFSGVKAIQSNSPSHNCPLEMEVDGVKTVMQQSVTYSGSLTPSLDSITPRFGPVTGGTSVTFAGQGFSSNQGDYEILIDGFKCIVTGATTSSVTCTTAKRPGLHDTKLEIRVAGRGLVSNKHHVFKYVSVWSDLTTWGNEYAPVDGESIWVPKGMNLYVDIDISPMLNALIVEGSLIFEPSTDPTHERFFDCYYIFVHKGTMEVGTEEFPYTSKIVFTMYGDVYSPYIPTYGNKVIGVRKGVLDMHGAERTPTWTQMATTATKGDSQITLDQEVDWVAGDHIAIAPSSYERTEYEKRHIFDVDRTNPQKPVITLDKPLEFHHFAGIEYFEKTGIDMRCEVGLLSRSVVLRGDPETSGPNQYGANIFIHSTGDDSVVARLANIELTQVGQAFKVGRYAIHFHMIGAVHKSYARGVSVHEGFNRAFTIHGTHNLRLHFNVVCHVKGHNFFIEDAVEQFNSIRNNLVMGTESSFSLLNTDQTPASFWITHPNNEFRNNRAAGSDRYGYWYDLQDPALGPSSSIGGCPNSHRVGIFMNNTAHSNGRYGLRIFHNMIPRQFACKPISFDWNNLADPFHKNPIQTMIFEDYTGYRNKRNGAIALNVGDVRFNNFKTADNILAGVEFEQTNNVYDGRPGVYNSVLVGRSMGNSANKGSPYGIIAPRTEWFTIRNVTFYNYDFNGAAALGDCSHCFHPAATDSGARTYTVSDLKFVNTPKRIKYQFPFKGIYHDLDGSLTGVGADTYATHWYKHLEQPECKVSQAVHNGVICTVPVRRVAFYGLEPASLFAGMAAYIAPWDDRLTQPMNAVDRDLFLNDKTKFGFVLQSKNNPSKCWAIPVVTGHKYRIHWANTGLDFEKARVQMSERWEKTDGDVYFVQNFTDVRVQINVTYNGVQTNNNSIPIMRNQWGMGQHAVYNDSKIMPYPKEFHFVLNGKDRSLYKTREMKFVGVRCFDPCLPPVVIVPIETNYRLWSKVSSWPTTGKVPEAGEDAMIESGWNMLFDVEETPIL